MQKGYESAETTAKRLGVTVRAVQKWASEGRFEGAYRLGRAWLIPTDAQKGEKRVESGDGNVVYTILPLMHSSVIPDSVDMVDEIFDDEKVAAIARAEYYYYTGEPEKTAEICELYIDHSNASISISAATLYLFANLVCGKSHLAELGLDVLRVRTKEAKGSKSKTLRAFGCYAEHLASILLNLDHTADRPLSEIVSQLPEGCRFFACYLLAHEVYMNGDIARAIGMADASIAVGCEKYPIVAVYTSMILTAAYVNVKDIERAKRAFLTGWDIASRYKMLLVVTEHYDMIKGMAEICLHKSDARELEVISRLGEGFGVAWRQLQNIEKNASMVEHFTPEEIAVAGLYRQGWSVKEISDYLGIMPRAVKHTISVIYEKLDISSRGELLKYFVR